jgi:hypothetical protein
MYPEVLVTVVLKPNESAVEPVVAAVSSVPELSQIAPLPPLPIIKPLLTTVMVSPVVPPVSVSPAVPVDVLYRYTPALIVIVMSLSPAEYPERAVTFSEAFAVLAEYVVLTETREPVGPLL